MNKIFDIILKLIIVSVLSLAIFSTQTHDYYVFIHWLIFLSSIYLAYSIREQIGIGGIRFGIIFFSLCSILFNPIMPFDFSKTTWRVIDLVVIIVVLLFMNLKEFSDSLSLKRRLDFNLFKSLFSFLALWSIAIWIFFYPSTVDFCKRYQLIAYPTTTIQGYITDAFDEGATESETQGTRYEYSFSYYFNTIDGKKINSSASEVGKIPEEYKNLSQNPYPIDIVYLNENPENNLPKNQMSESVIGILRTERIFMSFLIFAFGLFFSFKIIKRERNKYIAGQQLLNSEIQ